MWSEKKENWLLSILFFKLRSIMDQHTLACVANISVGFSWWAKKDKNRIFDVLPTRKMVLTPFCAGSKHWNSCSLVFRCYSTPRKHLLCRLKIPRQLWAWLSLNIHSRIFAEFFFKTKLRIIVLWKLSYARYFMKFDEITGTLVLDINTICKWGQYHKWMSCQ